MQDCENSLTSSEPEMDYGLGYGTQLLDDDVLTENDKDNVELKVEKLKSEKDKLKRQIASENDRIQIESERHEVESRETLVEWDKRKIEIKKQLDSFKIKLGSMKSEDLNNHGEFNEQLIEVKECLDELQSTQLDVRSYLDEGQHLLTADSISEAAKDDVQRNIFQTEEDFNNITQKMEDKQLQLQQVMDRLTEEEKVMNEWRERVRGIRYGLTVAENVVDTQLDAALTKVQLEDRLSAIEEINQVFIENEDEFESTLSDGQNLMSENLLSKDSMDEVNADCEYMKSNWIRLKAMCLEEEERLKTALQHHEERSDVIDKWHQQCDQLQHWITSKLSVLGSRPLSPDTSFGSVKRQHSVNEDLINTLLEKQDLINSVIDDGNTYVRDASIAREEREEIHSKMSTIRDDWDQLSDVVQERQRFAVEHQFKLERSHQDKIEGWRKRITSLLKWVAEAQQKLNKQFAIAPDLDTVQKQKVNIQRFTTEMLSHKQEVSGLLQDGDRLAKDVDVSEEERASINEENLHFGRRWKELEELISWKQSRLDDTTEKLKKQQHDKLAKWDEGLQDVSGWVETMVPIIETEHPLALDVDSAHRQLEEMQRSVGEAPLYQEKVNSLNEFSSNLVSDPCLGEEERVKLRLETNRCNERWNNFVNITNAQQKRLDQNLDCLESEQNASFEQWKTKYTRSSNMLDQFEAGIPILDQSVGNKIEELKRQQEHFEAFSDEVEANETQVNETCKLGERIRNEKVFSKTVRDNVEGQLNLVRLRWDRVQDFIVLRKARLDEASKRLGRDRQNKLESWEKKGDNIDKLIDQTEQKLKIHKIIDDDLPTVRQQTEDLSITVQNIKDSEDKVAEFSQLSDALLLESCIENSIKENVQKEKVLRVQRWNVIVDKTNKIQIRHQERLRELEVVQASMSQWLDQLIILQERVDDLNQICNSDLGPDYDTLLQRKKETEDALLQSQALEPTIADFMDQSDKLKNSSGINFNQQEKIAKESRELKQRLENLSNTLKLRQSSIDMVFKDLEKEQQRLLDEWQILSINTNKWMKDTAVRVEAQDSLTADLDLARAQKQDMEDLMNDMKQYEPNIDTLENVGDTLLKSPRTRESERERLANEKALLMGEWNNLNTLAHSVQSKLDDKVEKLKKEQLEKLEVWENKANPLEAWLNETEAELESFEQIGVDLETTNAQRLEAQNLINQLLHEQPRFTEVHDYGNTLTREPCVGLEERQALQERMKCLNEKWDDVYGKVTKRHDRLLEVLKPLEDEKRRKEMEQKKWNEEEEKRQRVEEERRRREEEKKRQQEEEERRLQEEEEKKRKEKEERKKLEEEEKKRREEEEKEKEEELIAFMMEIQPHENKRESERLVYPCPDESILVPVDDDMVESCEVSLVRSDPFSNTEGGTHEKVAEWRKEVDDINRWLDCHCTRLDNEFEEEDLVKLRKLLKATEAMESELSVYQEKYEATSETYNLELWHDPYLADDELKAVEDDMSKLQKKWAATVQMKDTMLKRLADEIRFKEQELEDKMRKSENNINQNKEWITKKVMAVDYLGPAGEDVQTISQQKDKLKEISQEIVEFEPQFERSIDVCYILSRNPALTPEQSHDLKCNAEDCEDLWDDLNESVREKVDELLERSSMLQQKQQEFLQKWIDKHEGFEATIKKCEERYEKNTPEGMDEIAIALRLEDSEGKLPQFENNGNVVWNPTINERQDSLRRAHKNLLEIRDRKKGRNWSLLDSIKDAVSSISKRLRKATRPRSIDLDRLIEHVEKHQELLQQTNDLQQQASDTFAMENDLQSNPAMDEENKENVVVEIASLRSRWNALNNRCINRGERLENLAKEIENEYEKFDTWHDRCDNMNQWLSESERLIKEEEKISTDIEIIKYQIKDNREFLNEVRSYEPVVDEFFDESRELMESSRLDKADVEGIEKTRNTLRRRWNEICDHLRDRQNRLEGMLLALQKKNSEDTLSRWKNQSSQLKLWLTSSEDKLSHNDNLDETDYGAIKEYATQVEDVEGALESSYNPELNQLTDSGFDILKKENLDVTEQGQVTEELNTLNKHIGKLESSARLKKERIKDASSKYFDRGVFELESSLDALEKEAREGFLNVGSDIMEIKTQLEDIKKFEKEMEDDNARFIETKEKYSDCKIKNLLNEDDCEKLEQRFEDLEKRRKELQPVHDDNRKRIVHGLIVLHEELMEEIYDWMEDTEMQIDSILINENDVESLKEELEKQKELDAEISSFEPQFHDAMGMSSRMICERYVEPERVETYEKEANQLENRMNTINLKCMDKSQRLFGSLAKYLTLRLDEAEVLLTSTEGRIHQEDEGFIDLELAKQQLDSQKDLMVDVSYCQREVSIILDDSSAIVKCGYFKEPEEEYFKEKISEIERRTVAVGENASKEHKRVFDTYLLLLTQHLNRINDWLSRAEARMNTVEEIGAQYDDVKNQLEEHQEFQDELRDHSLISAILELDITDPMISQTVRDKVKSMSERWATVWNWAEQRKNQLTTVITNWQRFRDEQLILLNWLATKEKQLKETEDTNLSDKAEVQEHLDSLREVEKELDEQGIRLQSLHKAGDDLLKKVDEEEEPTVREVRTQLKDFDECWNAIAKQVIGRVQALETSESKLKEYRSELTNVNEWMDSSEELVKGFTMDMDPKDATALQEKIEIKCEEKSKYQTRVDRISRLGKDLAGSIDKPSYEIIQNELTPFNKRWDEISNQLDTFSDKGYPDRSRGDCCFVRVMRKKFNMFQ